MVTRAVEGGLFWQQNCGSARTVDRGETRATSKFDLPYWQLKLGVLFVSQVNWTGFGFFAAALIKIQIFWNMAQCRSADTDILEDLLPQILGSKTTNILNARGTNLSELSVINYWHTFYKNRGFMNWTMFSLILVINQLNTQILVL